MLNVCKIWETEKRDSQGLEKGEGLEVTLINTEFLLERKKFLNYIMMIVANLYEYTNNHCTVHLKVWVLWYLNVSQSII